jgi:hypothetical protein
VNGQPYYYVHHSLNAGGFVAEQQCTDAPAP